MNCKNVIFMASVWLIAFGYVRNYQTRTTRSEDAAAAKGVAYGKEEELGREDECYNTVAGIFLQENVCLGTPTNVTSMELTTLHHHNNSKYVRNLIANITDETKLRIKLYYDMCMMRLEFDRFNYGWGWVDKANVGVITNGGAGTGRRRDLDANFFSVLYACVLANFILGTIIYLKFLCYYHYQ